MLVCFKCLKYVIYGIGKNNELLNYSISIYLERKLLTIAQAGYKFKRITYYWHTHWWTTLYMCGSLTVISLGKSEENLLCDYDCTIKMFT